MPTYEYRCRECGESLEVVQSFTDEPLRECPACAGPLRKVFGSIGITFKGSGFYKTDSRSGSASTAAKSEKAESSSSDGASSASSSDAPSSPEKSTTSSDTKKPSSEKSGSTSAA